MSPHRDRSRRALRGTAVVALAGLLVWVVSWLTAGEDSAATDELAPLSPSGPEIALGIVSVPLFLVGVFLSLWVVLLVVESLGADLAERRARP